MKKNKTSFDHLKENLALIIVVVGFIITWANLKGQVKVNTAEASSIRGLVERIIVLEETDKGYTDDFKTIKDDLKSIKDHLNIL